MALKRGMLIVLEGNDRVGKTTQAKRLVEWLRDQGRKTRFICFPDRSTPIGGLIDQYLKGELKMHDHSIHLLFSANRWEKYEEMKAAIKSGETIVVDRYSYSGVAYTASKAGADFEWARAPEKGLLKPDCVIFLSSDVKMLQNRGDFGSEVYETSAFQNSVREIYHKLKEDSWNVSNVFNVGVFRLFTNVFLQVIDANSRSIEEIHHDVINAVKSKDNYWTSELGALW